MKDTLNYESMCYIILSLDKREIVVHLSIKKWDKRSSKIFMEEVVGQVLPLMGKLDTITYLPISYPYW